MKVFLLFSLLLLSVYATTTPDDTTATATVTDDATPPFLARQSTCRRPRVICPGSGCIGCREVGPQLVRTIIALRAVVTRGNPSFRTRVNRFMNLIRDGGRADLSARMFRRDCCLRVFGTQVAQEVPELIAYGYIGRAVLPGSFLLGFAGFQKENEGSTIRDFVDELGPDFRGEFFNMCRVMGEFEIPCLRGRLASLRPALMAFADLNNDQHESAAMVGLAVGQTVGAFTGNERLLAREVRRSLRALARNELKRCCPAP